ncbi:MAG: hypothetical protein JXR70_05655 [Spirochaetales bacterium]|nr:hypothetical protein [Spirochaetales bacterium]
MKYQISSVVPWGRNLNEYKKMFSLSEADLDKKIIGFGDGPASFNCEMTRLGKQVVSLDPVYQVSKQEIQQRILESKDEVIDQTRKNMENFTWKNIKSVEELESIRMKAMELFVSDFEKGKTEGRYVAHSLPGATPYGPMEWDLGLSSHFLILYSQLGLDFHIDSIIEMLRVCKEIRIFPLLDLDARPSSVVEDVIECFKRDYRVKIVEVDYEFQKAGNKMLVIKH